MAVHPRSLSWREPRPKRQEWVCEVHGPLEPGESECATCEEPSLLARALGEAS